MSMRIRLAILATFIGTLVLLNIFIFSLAHPRELEVSFFDVGQGDAIFIQSPNGVQVLVDGGKDRAVLRALGERLPFWDRTIDAVVATHPDADHIGGLSDVFDRYEVGAFIESGVHNDTAPTAALERAVEAEEITRIRARQGMRLLLGSGVYADILYPDRDVSNIETNAGSIVMRLVYGNHEFMLTGDAPKAIEGVLVSAYDASLKSDVLKAGHHGSKTSSSEYFVEHVSPRYVVYSRGCENRYGHPAPEVIEVFARFGVHTFDTCVDGTVTFKTNGKTLRVER